MATTTIHNYLTKQDFIDILAANGQPLASEEVKKQAWEFIEKNDIPDKRLEEWKKTSLKKLLSHRFEYGKKMDLDKEYVSMFNLSGMYSNLLVFINGYFCPKLSRIIDNESVMVFSSMAEAKEKHPEIFGKFFNKTQAHKTHLFAALNTYYAADGAFIYIKKNTKVENPVHVYFFSHGDNRKTLSDTRNLIVADKGSKAQVLFSYHSLTTDFTFTNAVTEIILEDNSSLDFNIFQGEGDDSFQINLTKAHLEQGSNLHTHTTTLCGEIVRNDLQVYYNGPDAYADLNGLSMPDREQLHDNTLFVHHAHGGSVSNQFYRNIIDNNARAVFYGKVLIDKGASRTEAYQLNNNVLLTPYAKVHSKPHLVIFNDDVSASHGSTTGQLDQEALFYMQARGIGFKKARTILLQAFAREVLEKIKIPVYRFYVQTLVEKRLAGERVDMLCARLGECRMGSW